MQSISRLAVILASLLLLICNPNAGAQISVYGAAALTNFIFVNNGNTVEKSDTGGIVLGGFYNFPIDSRLTAGIDLRTSDGFGARGGTTVLAALRIGFVPKKVVLRPYFQLGGGVVTSSVAVGQVTGFPGIGVSPTRYTSGTVEFAFGLDIRLTPSLDLRAFELGAAAPVSSSNSTGVGSAFLDIGVVYHFPKHP
jgi:hypothetical protein